METKIFTLFRCMVISGLLVLSGVSRGQTPIWQENFDGPTINNKVWTYDVGGSGMGNQELENYTDRPDNSYIENGNLVICAKKENFGGNQFTSARLKTQGRFSFKYGSIEARIKLPNLKNGLWPGFWTMGTDIGAVGWPKCGEFDILEAGFAAAQLKDSINQLMTGAAHWWQDNGTWSTWLQADASAQTALPSGNFYDDYHIFKMVWDSTHVEFWLDSKLFFNMNTTDPNMSEFRQPHFILLNLAVGGSNYVNITDPAQITATFPAKMYVDYVKIYPIAGQTVVYDQTAAAETGNYGVYTETTPVNDKLVFGGDNQLYLWNNMTVATNVTPYEGSQVLAYNIGAGNWWGMGITCDDKNMSNYSDGYLHLRMKTTTTETISVGVSSSIGGDGFYDLVNGGQQYGLVRDGNWHEVKIPLNLFAIDFNTIKQIFMMKGAAPAAAFSVAVDDIYWIPSGVAPVPVNGNFGIYTDNTACAVKFNTSNGTDGNFYVWSNTLTATTTNPSEGSNVLSFTSAPGLTWFGAAFTPNVKYNLTAFRYSNSTLHFDMKTTSTTTFQIGIKSGNVANIGQTWITFTNGADPYGFVRDGNWHGVDIPMSTFTDVDLSQVSQLFELLGTTGAISNIAIDNIYYAGAGAPIIGSNVSVTGVTLSPATASIITGATSQLTATIAPSNATNNTVTWTSSNTAVATVSSTGLITAVTAGTATITATTQDGNFTATCTITVTAPVTGVTMSTATLAITKGSTSQLTATVTPSNATNKTVTWASSNTGVVTVSSTGLVTGIAAGTATITVSTQDGNKTATCAITVTSGTNLALGKPATSSSNENGYAASSANDGNAGTRWSSGFSDPQWIMVDLQNTYNINKVVLNWETAAGKAYQIQVSPDGTTWTSIYTTTTGIGGIETLSVTGTGRYIRMYGTARTTAYGYSLWEFEVYGSLSSNIAVTGVNINPTNASIAIGATNQLTASVTPSNATNPTVTWTSSNTGVATVSSTGIVMAIAAGTATITATTQDGNKTATCTVTVTSPTTNLALNKPATSSTNEAGFTASGANDGNTGTRWSSGFSDPQWIMVDLQASYNLTKVVLNWEAAAGKAYQIQVSPDGTTWTTIYSTTTGAGGIETLNVTGTGRYIRMYGTARTTQYGYSLWEFEVYGTSIKAAKLESEEDNTPSVKVVAFPNPATSQVTIALGFQNVYQVAKVFNLSGRIVAQWVIASDASEISNDISYLANGIYLIRLEGAAKSETIRIVKQ